MSSQRTVIVCNCGRRHANTIPAEVNVAVDRLGELTPEKRSVIQAVFEAGRVYQRERDASLCPDFLKADNDWLPMAIRARLEQADEEVTDPTGGES